MPSVKGTVVCSFCEKSGAQLKKVISGNNAYICEECIALCTSIISGKKMQNLNKKGSLNSKLEEEKSILIDPIENFKPQKIYEALCEHVIGQDHVKKNLAVAVYNHYIRLKLNLDKDVWKVIEDESSVKDIKSLENVEVSKSNVLLIGPSGVGKTLLAETLAKTLNLPFVIADATTLTETGYVGEDVEGMVSRLLQVTNYDVKRAEIGIIFIDEIDKRKRTSASNTTRDISGEGVQQALLKLIEGTKLFVPAHGTRRSTVMSQEMIQIDTKNILFICAGAFDGLDKIIEKRISSNSIGFGVKIKKEKHHDDIYETISKVEAADLVQYGLIPEFVGRLPVIMTLKQMDKDMIKRILIEPKNSLLKQYKKIFAVDRICLDLTEDAIDEIVDMTVKNNTGARGLRSILDSIFNVLKFDLLSQKIGKVLKLKIDKEKIISILNSNIVEKSEKQKAIK